MYTYHWNWSPCDQNIYVRGRRSWMAWGVPHLLKGKERNIRCVILIVLNYPESFNPSKRWDHITKRNYLCRDKTMLDFAEDAGGKQRDSHRENRNIPYFTTRKSHHNTWFKCLRKWITSCISSDDIVRMSFILRSYVIMMEPVTLDYTWVYIKRNINCTSQNVKMQFLLF